MKAAGFFEFQTPILTASSPEGARDYLVPSRIHPGKFYALPQAPQQYKQLLMMAGFDRYFQIAPCFRDEDPRADRLPGEFYQLDVEMSFVTQEDVFATIEPVIHGVFEEFGKGKTVTQSFPRIPHAQAMRKYGSDKPDLRNPIEMQDVSEHFRGCGLQAVRPHARWDQKAQVWAIPAPGGGSRAFCDRMNSWAQGEGQPGLGYIFWREGGGLRARSPTTSAPSGPRPCAQKLGLEGRRCRVLRRRRPREIRAVCRPGAHRLGEELKLVDENRFELAWIVDFPMYEWDEEDKKIEFSTTRSRCRKAASRRCRRRTR